MKEDIVDELVRQWAIEHPQMDTAALRVVVRLQFLAKRLKSRSTRALARYDLKLWEYDVLSVLRRQGDPFELPASDLARAALLTTGAMTTRIDGLERRKLVRRRQAKTDRRSVLVRLTRKGLDVVDAAIGTRVEDANAALSTLSSAEIEQLSDVLLRVSQNIDKMRNKQ